MFELRSENLTQLGGRMGTERTFDNWRKFFETLDEAKNFAEKDFGSKLTWLERAKSIYSTEDLNYVMYHITKIGTEKA